MESEVEGSLSALWGLRCRSSGSPGEQLGSPGAVLWGWEGGTPILNAPLERASLSPHQPTQLQLRLPL